MVKAQVATVLYKHFQILRKRKIILWGQLNFGISTGRAGMRKENSQLSTTYESSAKTPNKFIDKSNAMEYKMLRQNTRELFY